jgi:hypothetical protein
MGDAGMAHDDCERMTRRAASGHGGNTADATGRVTVAHRHASLRSALLRAAAITLLAGAGAASVWAPARADTAAHHQAAKSPHHADVEQSGVPHLPVRMIALQHAGWGRLTFELGGNAAPEVRQLPDGVELHFAAGTVVQIPSGAKLRQIAAIETSDADGAPMTVVRLACDCAVSTDITALLLRLDVRENPRQDHARQQPPQQDHAQQEHAPQDRSNLEHAQQERPTQEHKQQQNPRQPEHRGAPANTEAGELEKMRNDLTAKLAILNAPPPAAAPAAPSATPAPVAPAADTATDAAQPAAAGPPPVCLPVVDMALWRNNTKFLTQLIDLRARVGRSHASPRDMAALAEFYLAYGLGEEALAAAADGAADDTATPDDHTRLVRDADIARLLKGEQLDPASPLLASPPGCERTDAALWRALASAAAHDADGVAQAAGGAGLALRRVPEPLLQRLAYRIADAVNDNKAALLAMAGAVRNTEVGIPEDEAARFLLQARLAQFGNDPGDYETFLERAAQHDLTVPGLIAKARLAALRVTHEDPDTAHNEAVLADLARTYRFEAFGQRAAEHYAERRMQQGDYASALAIADESAGPTSPTGERTSASRGAMLAARILRILLVDPGKDKTALPAPSERLALYWRYQGYTTPGDKGDDIRIGVARLMLAQRLPDAALGVLRQVAGSTAAAPDVVMLRAEAEARAGDAAAALTMLQAVPDGDATHRIAAAALERIGRFADAAHALDPATDLADKRQRAGLLFRAAAWSDAATAYADVLAAAGSDDAARGNAAERYALALALAGGTPPDAAPKLPESPARLLAVLQPEPASAPSATAALPALRGALDRARLVEQLLPPATAHQGS